MAKNIVICCDGTGGAYGDCNTNVVHIYEALIVDGERQVGYYHPGVGTEGSPTSHGKLGVAWSKVMGLAFGAGLLRNIGDAYRYLMNVYEEGDKVYLFGFSRGAYTARAIAGVLHMFGLLCPGNDALIPYILQFYAKQTRKAGGMTSTFTVAEGFKKTFCRPCPLHLVGVWDTVSSVGWIWDPVKLPYTGRNPDVANGRHAMSIDERRCKFHTRLWGAPFPGQTIKQVWFAGVHCDVGGGYPTRKSGLSQIALQWMLCEAVSLGLLVDPERANRVVGRTSESSIPRSPVSEPESGRMIHHHHMPHPPVPPNPAQKKNKSLTGPWWLLELLPEHHYNAATKKKKWRIPLGAWRTIPPDAVFHVSVRQKLAEDRSYKPPNLPTDFETNPSWKHREEPDNPCIFS